LVSNNEVDQIYNTALRSGAVGGKLLGAGGGGFILFYAPKKKHQDIINNLNHLIHVPFKFENSGSTVALYQPNGL
jgi:D-glycero-alpha-D-manno-heptose-7-phosphate kinase